MGKAACVPGVRGAGGHQASLLQLGHPRLGPGWVLSPPRIARVGLELEDPEALPARMTVSFRPLLWAGRAANARVVYLEARRAHYPLAFEEKNGKGSPLGMGVIHDHPFCVIHRGKQVRLRVESLNLSNNLLRSQSYHKVVLMHQEILI